MPDTVTVIGEKAFYGCYGMSSLTLSNSLTEIPSSAFNGCAALTSLTIPDSVTTIGDWAFNDCMKLKEVTMPDSVSSIREYAFRSTAIKTFTFPRSVRSVEAFSFAFCYDLESVTIPDSIQTIGEAAFVHCHKLDSLILPSSVTSIGDRAFENCRVLKEVYYTGSQQQWNDCAFDLAAMGLSADTPVYCNSSMNPLRIISHPADVNAEVGSDVSFTVVAKGDSLKYQWYYRKAGATEWSKWGTRTAASTTATSNVTWYGMQVYCKVTDKNGASKDTNPATVTVTQYLKITTQPKSCSILLGKPVTLSVKAEGIGLRYQWYFRKKGQTSYSKWNGHTHASETCTPNASWDGIQLYCIVWDITDIFQQSSHITVNVLSIATQPKNVTVEAGKNATFTVRATGSELKYQWQYMKKGAAAWSNWNGRTTASTTATANSTWNGMQVRCVVTDGAGNQVTSNAATVTIASSLAITAQPTGKAIKLGDSLKLSLTATGSGLSYQWYFKKAGQTSFSPWNGRTHASETVAPNATWDGIQLYCVVKDSTGNSKQSSTVTIRVLAITTQPKNVTVAAGKKATFTVKTTGAGLIYQWQYKKKGAIAWSNWNGRTTASTTATSNTTWNGMQVRCVVTDSAGNIVYSDAAVITIAG